MPREGSRHRDACCAGSRRRVRTWRAARGRGRACVVLRPIAPAPLCICSQSGRKSSRLRGKSSISCIAAQSPLARPGLCYVATNVSDSTHAPANDHAGRAPPGATSNTTSATIASGLSATPTPKARTSPTASPISTAHPSAQLTHQHSSPISTAHPSADTPAVAVARLRRIGDHLDESGPVRGLGHVVDGAVEQRRQHLGYGQSRERRPLRNGVVFRVGDVLTPSDGAALIIDLLHR